MLIAIGKAQRENFSDGCKYRTVEISVTYQSKK